MKKVLAAVGIVVLTGLLVAAGTTINGARTVNGVLTLANGAVLGTPASVNLSNATALPCAAMPALTGGVTSSAGSCATTVTFNPVIGSIEFHPQGTVSNCGSGTTVCTGIVTAITRNGAGDYTLTLTSTAHYFPACFSNDNNSPVDVSCYAHGNNSTPSLTSLDIILNGSPTPLDTGWVTIIFFKAQ
jgi:hypothetical protein